MKYYFEILQISESAEEEIIKAAYRKLSAKYHSDNLETGDEDRFKDISEAYSVLSDPEKRKNYLSELHKYRHQKEEPLTVKATDGKMTETRETIDKLVQYYNELIDLRKIYFACKEKIEKNQNSYATKIRKRITYFTVSFVSFLLLFIILFIIERAMGWDAYLAEYSERFIIMVPAFLSVMIVYFIVPVQIFMNRNRKPKMSRKEKKLLEQLGVTLQADSMKFVNLHRELLSYISPKYMNSLAIVHIHDQFHNNKWSTLEELFYSWDLICSDEHLAASNAKVITMDEEVKQFVLSIMSR